MSDDKRRGTVKLSQYNEQAQVAPSATRDGSVAVGFYNAEGTEPVHPGCFTGDEWDAFVAAGNAALGRPSTPLLAAIEARAVVEDAEARKRWNTDGDEGHGRAEGLRAAAAMVREAGPTVPRVAVAAVVAEIDALECADEDAIAGIRRSLAALLAPSMEGR